METTFKIVLDKRYSRKDLTFPLRLRLYQNRNYKEHTIGIYIREAEWNEQLQEVSKSNASHKIYNAKIVDLKARLRKAILFNDDEEEQLSLEKLLSLVTPSKKKKQENKPDIIAYGKKHIATLQEQGRIGSSISYSCAINKLKGFANADNLPFETVNYSFIERFNTSLLSEGMKVNGISNYMRSIRALFNRAIREGIIKADCYPFSKFKIKNERTINRTLNISEIRSIAGLDLIPQTTIWHHRNLFLLSYCLIGMNFSDLLTLTKENFVDGRIIFRRKKTHKVYSILIQPKVKEILGHYRNETANANQSFLLPFIQKNNSPIQLKKDIQQAIKNTNDYLSKITAILEIEKPVTTYYARYSWANIARSMGYAKDLIAEALGHEYGNKVTGIYLDNYSNSVLDEMNAKVIEASFYKE